ncbi:hypothetical protein C8Q80DRAFT_1136785 [Daedaleopsis nitida]|nr:hypothetical protein C8Q80DRAFT_1136785 [Daedaleopsis nitida]
MPSRARTRATDHARGREESQGKSHRSDATCICTTSRLAEQQPIRRVSARVKPGSVSSTILYGSLEVCLREWLCRAMLFQPVACGVQADTDALKRTYSEEKGQTKSDSGGTRSATKVRLLPKPRRQSLQSARHRRPYASFPPLQVAPNIARHPQQRRCIRAGPRRRRQERRNGYRIWLCTHSVSSVLRTACPASRRATPRQQVALSSTRLCALYTHGDGLQDSRANQSSNQYPETSQPAGEQTCM